MKKKKKGKLHKKKSIQPLAWAVISDSGNKRGGPAGAPGPAPGWEDGLLQHMVGGAHSPGSPGDARAGRAQKVEDRRGEPHSTVLERPSKDFFYLQLNKEQSSTSKLNSLRPGDRALYNNHSKSQEEGGGSRFQCPEFRNSKICGASN